MLMHPEGPAIVAIFQVDVTTRGWLGGHGGGCLIRVFSGGVAWFGDGDRLCGTGPSLSPLDVPVVPNLAGYGTHVLYHSSRDKYQVVFHHTVRYFIFHVLFWLSLHMALARSRKPACVH